MNLPKKLYHYTSIDAFKGIVDGENLRLTRFDQLNDPQEVSFAVGILVDYIKRFPCKREHEPFKSYLLEIIPLYPQKKSYICSFSESGNELSQWRAYTPSGGVAIGFASNELEKGYYTDILSRHMATGLELAITQQNRSGSSFVQCLYAPSEKLLASDSASPESRKIEKQVYECLEFMFNSKKDGAERFVSNSWNAVFENTCYIFIFNLVACLKHSAYSIEKEWRLFKFEPLPEEFPVFLSENNNLYINARIIPKEWIKEVVISPHGDKKMIKRVLGYYKDKLQLDFEIKESFIPYRI